MSNEKPHITIIGLGMIGSSIGLALQQADVASAVIGHDIDRSVSNEAKKLGAVDKLHWNLISACDKSDLIILATPVGAIEETMKAIGPELKPGTVVIDTASLKGPVMAWAAEHLPAGIHFVGSDPILGTAARNGDGLLAARADLFQRGLFCLVPSPSADPDSVKLATDLVAILGAKPLFLDAAEHDGLLGAVEHLPGVLALALMETMIHQPAWRELRKVAGPAFEISTELVTNSALAGSDLYVLNSENLLRWIDALTASLGSIRENVADSQAEALAEKFQNANQERQRWLADRAGGEWHEGPRTETPERVNMIDTFFGTFWRRKPKEKS